jgi:hypothetical protein
MFPRDMVCLRNISVDTLHKEDNEVNNNNNNNNNNKYLQILTYLEGNFEPGPRTEYSVLCCNNSTA